MLGFKKLVQDFKRTLKQNPKSKRNSFMRGFAMVLGISTVIFFSPTLSAVAKDIPKGNPKPIDIRPAPALPAACVRPGKKIINPGIAGLTGLAITSGAFSMGVACGLIVLIGILYIRRK